MPIETLALLPQSVSAWIVIEAIGIIAVIFGFLYWIRSRQPPQ